MNYFTEEVWDEAAFMRTAGNKARDDISAILKANGYNGISVAVPNADRREQTILEKAGYHIFLRNKWRFSLGQLKKGDTLLIQFPIIQHSVLLADVIAGVRRRGVKIVLLIHDLEILRSAKRDDVSLKEKVRLRLEEETLLKQCDCMIVHNPQMRKKLAELGFSPQKMVVLGLFDYLIPEKNGKAVYSEVSREAPVVIAGALRRHKAGYTYALPAAPEYNLYGVDYEGAPQENVHYHGSFPSDDLPGMMKGSFGLVWDGDSTGTCSGTYGEYLRINNPHKASLYLASGLPVIIWKEAALADYITRRECGIAAESLEEIPELLAGMSEQQYEDLRAHALVVASKLRNGSYTLRALRRAKEKMGD